MTYREALRRGSDFFKKRDIVNETPERVTKRLEEAHIPYAIIGGMAMASLRLPRELGGQLDPSVRDEYFRMWQAAQTPDVHEQGS